jgi:MFS superfamily sulfate permease-like transporter
MAAIIISGSIPFLLELLKFGKYADIFYSTIIHSILVAIGVIFIAKQIHIALG